MKSLSATYAGSFGIAGKGRNLSFALLLTAFLTFSVLHVLAQEATIVGTVTDASGAVVPGTVVIHEFHTGTTRSLTTNSDGQYAAPRLSIGRYDVRAEAKGFKCGERKGIVLNVADRIRVDFKLEVGNAQETIAVEASAVAVQTDTGEVSTVINSEQISQLRH